MNTPRFNFVHVLSIVLILSVTLELSAQTIASDTQKLAEVVAGKVQVAHAIWWGFDVEDSTAQLQAALDCNAKTIIVDCPTIDGKTYPWIVRPLNIKGNREIVFAQNVEILAKKGEFLGKADSLVSIVSQSNVTLRAEKAGTATLRMRKTDYHKAPYERAEWRHALNIKSSSNILVDGLNMVDSGGDGIYLGKSKKGVTNSNITIRNVVCDGNNRQGISVITAENLLIEKTILRNTWGTAPQAGIDFEPNTDDEKLANCVMRDCICENNAGQGIENYLPNLKRCSGAIGLTFENVISRNNRNEAFFLVVSNSETDSLTGTVTVRNCNFENNRGGILISSLAENGASVTVENTTVKNCSVQPDGNRRPFRSPILFSSRVRDESAFGKAEFKNVTIIDNCTDLNGSQPFFKFSDGSINGFGLSYFNGTFNLINDKQEQKIVIDSQTCNKFWSVANYRKLPRLKVVPQEVKPCSQQSDKQNAFDKIYSRNNAQYWIYAQEGQTVQFTLEQKQVGRYSATQSPVIVTQPSGKKQQFPTTQFENPVEYKWTASQTGTYLVDVNVGMNAVAMTSCNVPVAINGGNAVHLVYTIGSLYFYIPEGIKEFGVKVFGSEGERVKATLFSPDGKQVWQEDNICSAKCYFSEENQTPQAGIWRIQFDRPTTGVLEDFGFVLLGVKSLPGPNSNGLLQ